MDDKETREAFDKIDQDGSGFITMLELRQVLGRHATTDQLIEDIINQADVIDGNGQINYEEFVKGNRPFLRKTEVAN